MRRGAILALAALTGLAHPRRARADAAPPPAWAADAVFYQIFPDRFANGDPANDPQDRAPWDARPTHRSFMGGDLAGIAARLDYLKELGVNAIWLTPIFEAASNHRYDTTDYRRVDPRLGDRAALERLVREARAAGIRVVLDAVFNHTGTRFFAFRDLLERQEASPYRHWYHLRRFPVRVERDPPYATFGHYASLPKLAHAHPEVRRHLLDTAREWMNTGIAGWRLDAADEVPAEFWRELRRTVKAADPEALLLGETWKDARPWLQGDQWDGAMNYPWRDAVHRFFLTREIPAAEFGRRLAHLRARYGPRATLAMYNLLGSHDTPRLATIQPSRERRALALLFQMTYPGMPAIYYGDEVGLEGGPDPDCRRAMPWEPARQDLALLARVKALVRLRRERAALRRGEFREVAARDGLYAYLRATESERLLVATNASGQPAALELDPGLLGPETTHAAELLGKRRWSAGPRGKIAIEVPAWGGLVLEGRR